MRRRLLLMLVVLVPLWWGHVTASPALACSCVEPQPLAFYAREAHNAVFTGTVASSTPRGVSVTVDAWFSGRGAAPVVWLAPDSFGDSAACGVGEVPAPGSQWIWVAWRSDPGADFSINICQPYGNLARPEGQALLAEALELFGQPPTPPAARPTAVTPVDGQLAGTVMLGIAAAFAAIVIAGGVALLVRRRASR